MRRLLFSCALFSSTLAFAHHALGDEVDQDAPPDPVPYATDEVGGHVRVTALGGYTAPFGHISGGTKSTARSGDGFHAGGEFSYGMDRYVTLGAYGEYQGLGGSGRCPSCEAISWGAGLFVGYHFVQGLRFDPYISYGLGFRALSSESDDGSFDYIGLEWLRLQFGGDWFASPHLGIGPFLQVGGGTMLGLPDDENVSGAYFRFQLGLRLTLDVPGR